MEVRQRQRPFFGFDIERVLSSSIHLKNICFIVQGEICHHFYKKEKKMTLLLIPEKPLHSPFWSGCFNKLKLLGWVTSIFLDISLPKDTRHYILLSMSPSLVNLASVHDDHSLKNVFHSDNFLFFSLAVPCFDQSRFISFHFILGLILALSPNSTFKQNSTFSFGHLLWIR